MRRRGREKRECKVIICNKKSHLNKSASYMSVTLATNYQSPPTHCVHNDDAIAYGIPTTHVNNGGVGGE